MQFKYIVVIVLTALLTVFFMQNSEPVVVKFIFADVSVSKLALLPGLSIAGFLIGYILGRTGKKKSEKNKDLKDRAPLSYSEEGGHSPEGRVHSSEGGVANRNPSGLSQQDEHYIR